MLLSSSKKTTNTLTHRPMTAKPSGLSQTLNKSLNVIGKITKFKNNLENNLSTKKKLKFENSYQSNNNNTSLNQSTRSAGFKSFQGKRLANALGKSLIASSVKQRKESSSGTGTVKEDDTLLNGKTSLKEMIESATADQRALSLIDDTIELFAHNHIKDSKGSEKYELIGKDEFEKMKKDNEIFKKQRKEMHEEYQKLKEAYEKISYELNTMNYVYYNVEKSKTDSITKIYSMENELKRLVIYNNKLQNEIVKEINEKNNVFRALNEFKRKYETDIPDEIKDIYHKITDDVYNPVLEVDNKERLDLLEDKIEKMKSELQEKDEQIEKIKQRIEEINKETNIN